MQDIIPPSPAPDSPPNISLRTIFGIPTLSVSPQQAVALLDQRLAGHQPVAVSFLNAHAASIALKNKAFQDCLQNFTIFNDGIGVDIASWLKYGSAYPHNLNGTDFTPIYLKETTHRFRIFLLGALPEIADKTATVLAAAFPHHEIVGTSGGYIPPDENAALAARIKQTGATMILVAMGNPLQELWIARHLEATGAKIAIGVGGLFDFIAGKLPRAPRLVRKLRGEWLFRLCQEPSRLWKRYTLESASFLGHALWDAHQHRIKGKKLK